MSKFRFDEDVNFQKVIDYVSGTYGEHYAHEVNGKNIQVIDMWEGLGSLMTTSRDTSLKYISRFGRKNGYNEKDLLKAIHYILLMMYAAREEMGTTVEPARPKTTQDPIQAYPVGYEQLDQTAADHVIRDARDYSEPHPPIATEITPAA
jgi:hypothetical protein